MCCACVCVRVSCRRVHCVPLSVVPHSLGDPPITLCGAFAVGLMVSGQRGHGGCLWSRQSGFGAVLLGKTIPLQISSRVDGRSAALLHLPATPATHPTHAHFRGHSIGLFCLCEKIVRCLSLDPVKWTHQMIYVFEYEAFPNYGMNGVGFHLCLFFKLYYLWVVMGSTMALCPSVNMERDSPGQLVHIHT